jgi:uncharacterized protein with PQ loop repeat
VSSHLLFSIIGWIAAFLGLPGTIVQYRRILKDGVEGISVATWMLFAFMCVYWIAYGVAVSSWVVIMGSLIVFPFQLLVISHLSPMKHLKIVFGSAVFIIICAWLPAMIWGWNAGVYGTGFAMVMNRMPQLIELIRVKHVFGVSASSWAIGSLGSFLWIIYYISERMWAAFFATLVSGIVNVLIMILTIWRHHQVKVEESTNSIT